MTSPNDLFLTSDFGTQGCRVGVADMEGNLLATKEEKYPIHYPKPGYAVQNSDHWWSSFKVAAVEVLETIGAEARSRVRAIAICATSSSVVPVDEEGEALADAMMWMDVRSKGVATRINETRHPVLSHCGDAVSPEWFIPKLLWIKENERDLYDRAHLIVEQQDLINFRLTGTWAASKVQAVCKWNYVDGAGFDDDYMGLIGLEDYRDKIICNVLPMGAVIGNMREELASELGIDSIPVVQGGIDAHIGTVGMGVVKPGILGANMGTSFVQLIFTDVDKPVTGVWGPYTGAMIPGLTLLEGGQISAGSLVKWYQSIFDIQGSEAFDIMREEVKGIPIGADGLIALDFFQGNRTPYKDSYSKGALFGLTLNHDRAHIHRALMEAVALGFKNIIVNFEKQGVPVNKVICTGGVTFDKVWMKILADATGKPFVINENTNYGTLLGPAMLAATGVGAFRDLEDAADHMVHRKEQVDPDLSVFAEYERLFRIYCELYEKTKGLARALAADTEDQGEPLEAREIEVKPSENDFVKVSTSTVPVLTIASSNGGYGGPLNIPLDGKRDEIVYLTALGERPALVDKVAELTGMKVVNGFMEKVSEEKTALMVIDCGGSLRCGVYPRKGIPTVNLVPTGRSGLFWTYMTEDLYVSGSTEDDVELNPAVA